MSKLSLICEFAKLSIDNLDTLRFRLVLVAMNLVTSAGVLLWEYKKYSRDGFFGGEDTDSEPEATQPEIVAAANASAAGGGGVGDESMSLWLALGVGVRRRFLTESANLNPAFFRMIGLLFFSLWISHLFGCLWYMVVSN